MSVFVKIEFYKYQKIFLIYISFILTELNQMRQDKKQTLQSISSMFSPSNYKNIRYPFVSNTGDLEYYLKKGQIKKNTMDDFYSLESNGHLQPFGPRQTEKSEKNILFNKQMMRDVHQNCRLPKFYYRFSFAHSSLHFSPFAHRPIHFSSFAHNHVLFKTPYNYSNYKCTTQHYQNISQASNSSSIQQITQAQGIQNIRSGMTQQQSKKCLPSINAILNYFKHLSLEMQRLLKTNDYRRGFDKYLKTATNHDRCHIIGLKCCEGFFIWVVKNSNWRPSKKTVRKLLKNVVNFQGNFVIDSRQRNNQWWNMGERVFLNVLEGQYPQDQQKARGLLKFLSTIKRRYRDFFKRCCQNGLPREAACLMYKKFEEIYVTLKRYLNIQ